MTQHLNKSRISDKAVSVLPRGMETGICGLCNPRAPHIRLRQLQAFAARKAFAYPTNAKRAAFTAFQTELVPLTKLVFFDLSRQLLIKFDASKEGGTKTIAYDVQGEKKNQKRQDYCLRSENSLTTYSIYISRILKNTETKY